MDKASESLTGAGDRIAGAVQPGTFRPLPTSTPPHMTNNDNRGPEVYRPEAR